MSESELKAGIDAIVEQLKQLNANLTRMYTLQLMELDYKRIKGQYLPNTPDVPLTESLLTLVSKATQQVNKIAK